MTPFAGRIRTGQPYHVQVCVSEPGGGVCRSSSFYCTPGLTPTEGQMPDDLWDVPCYEEHAG